MYIKMVLTAMNMLYLLKMFFISYNNNKPVV